MSEYPDIRIPGHPDIGMLGFPVELPPTEEKNATRKANLRKSGIPDFRIFGNPQIRISGNPDFRIFGNPQIRISGNPDFRIVPSRFFLLPSGASETVKNIAD